jgi:hypothetical protein
VGLSGAGKSNLAGFLVYRGSPADGLTLVDCNRLGNLNPASFFQLIRRALGSTAPVPAGDELAGLDQVVGELLEAPPGRVCLVFDRFDGLPLETQPQLYGNLRALRDAYKYRLTYVTFTRRPLDGRSELAELFYAHTLWLGPLSESDTRWSIDGYRQRSGQAWDEPVYAAILQVSGRYPSFLRAACETIAAGCPPEAAALRSHPAVQRRVEEFWASAVPEDLQRSGLEGLALLGHGFRSSELTAKEALLLKYLQAHPQQVCEKDELMRAVWPEVKVYDEGLQDDSLAQLVRRLRTKIEPDPSNPSHIFNVPGRGYRFTP